MQKLIAVLLGFFLTGQAYTQTDSIPPDSATQVATQKKITENRPIPSSINIYPNPAKNKVTLQVAGFEPGIATVKIMDIKGKPVRQESRLLTNGSEEIIMFLMLPPGIYFVMVSEKGKLARKKLVML
jgi:hypothetical protein